MNKSIGKAWSRTPVIIRSILNGALAASMGTVPWAILAGLNLKYGSGVPWAALVMAVYLWFYWRYVNGKGWPASTSEFRRTNCRANKIADEVWGAAILAGFVGLIALVLFQGVFARMVVLPQSVPDDLSNIPFLTVVVSLIMSSLVAGVVEESSFRGYIQGPIERRHGPVVAIFITGTLFGFAHFTHPEVTLILLPWYMAVALLYGTIAYLTNSILPGIVIHAGGNILGYINQMTLGKTEWQGPSKPGALIWETGPDAAFWTSLVFFLLATAAAVWAYTALSHVAHKSRKLQD